MSQVQTPQQPAGGTGTTRRATTFSTSTATQATARVDNSRTDEFEHTVDILYEADGGNWEQKTPGKLSDIYRNDTDDARYAKSRIVVLPRVIPKKEDPNSWFGPFFPEPDDHALEFFRKQFGIPDLFWTKMRRKACGYFCCQDVPDKNGNRMGHVTMMKSLTIKVEDEPRQRSDETGKRNYFPYEWLPLELAVFWHDKRRTLQAVVMQASPEVRERIKKVLLPGTTPPFHLEPLGLHVFLFERVLEMYDNSFWFLRDNLPKVESRQKPGDTPRPDYPLVHDLARHVIHHTESLEIAIDTLDTLKSCHDECGHDEAGVTTSPVSPQGGGPGATSAGASSGTDHGGLTTALATAGTRFDAQLVAQRNAIQQHRRLLRHYDKMLRQFLARSRSLNERIRNEINLSFNSVVQYDSRAMKTISFLTLFFLPGTFVSSILGTNFFNYGEHDPRFHMSSLFWPGWAAPTVGLTLAVLLIWWKWYASSTKVRTSGGSGPKVKGARWGFGVRREETEDGDGTASQRKHRRKVVVPGWKSFNSSQARLDAVPNSAA